MNRLSPRRNRTAFSTCLLIFGLFACAPSIVARQAPVANKPSVDPAERPKFKAMFEALNQRAREAGLVSIADDPAQEDFIRRRREAQLTEDFSKLYSINAETIATQAAAPTPNYKALCEATADLRTRASRIKNGVPLLHVADKGEKPKYEENPDHLPTMIPELNRMITSFLNSPVFSVTSANDTQIRLKASRDLDGIIKLSDTINKILKKSNKAGSN
jgi:hypothetical protein